MTGPSRRDRLAWSVLLAAACLLTYANGVTGAFTYDDKAILRDNPRIRSPAELDKIFATQYFGGPRGNGSVYRPVLLVSYAVQWWIHGRQVVAFHAVNVLIHLLATILLARLLLRMGLSPPVCRGTALLFAVHPIHVEAVTSLVGRGETLSAVFVLTYLHLALRRFRGELRGPAWLPALAGCYALGVLAKEGAVVAPGLALLVFLFVAEGSLLDRARVSILRGGVLFGASALALGGVFALRFRVFGGLLKAPGTGFFEVENPLAPLNAAQRAVNACLIFFRYLGRCVFPLHLSADESAWSIRVLPTRAPLSIIATVLLAALTLLALTRLSRRSTAAFGFLLFALALLPAGNVLFPIGTIFAERLAYLSSAGVCLVLTSWILGGTTSRDFAGIRRVTVLAIVAFLFAARAVIRNAVWWTDESLFTNLIATSPGSAKAYYDYAYVRAFQNRHHEALTNYARAIQIYDGYWDAWAGKGRMEKELGLLDRAEKSYQKSIAVYPGYENGFFGLGLVREARGDFGGAAETYRRGLESNPESLPLAFRLAIADSALGKPEAEREWRRALSLGRNSVPVLSEHASWLLRGGRIDAARRQAREALRRDPRFLPALRLLAEANARAGSLLGEGLAREKIFRLTRSSADWAALERVAREDEAYRGRFENLRRALERLSPASPSRTMIQSGRRISSVLLLLAARAATRGWRPW